MSTAKGIEKPPQRGEQTQNTAKWIPKSKDRGPYVNVAMSGRAPSKAFADFQGYSVTSEDKATEQQRYVNKVTKTSNPRSSYANAVKKGGHSQESFLVVIGAPIGNGWLYRSVVATFGDHQNSDTLLGSFINQERGDVSVRKLGNKKILITFPSEDRIITFMDMHKSQGSYWFKSVVPWSVNTDYGFEREI
ncbi:hypothetical protein Dimus_012661 [Dionaea muscipula]